MGTGGGGGGGGGGEGGMKRCHLLFLAKLFQKPDF